jgi:hypothetical protein
MGARSAPPGQHLHVATEHDAATGAVLGPHHLQPRLRRARGLRARERAAALGHRRPQGVPGAGTGRRRPPLALAATALAPPLRSGPRPLRRSCTCP